MAQHIGDGHNRFIALKHGTKMGLVAGVALVILGWIVAGLIELLIGWVPPTWSEWFPQQIVNTLVSDWWMIGIIVSFTAAGALISAFRPGRYALR